ncbi:hypothetical protein ACRWOO_28140 [Streptomyces sp. NEAU-PBA10]|uniref:hypothetical protein n=1 Tax=Streptomyces sp. NEAU-PBA10 TaxID=3438640 RepID=UPI003F793D0F
MPDPLISSARAAQRTAARALLRHGPRHPATRARLIEAARVAGHAWDAGHPVTEIHPDPEGTMPIPSPEDLRAAADRQRAEIDALALATTHQIYGPDAARQQAEQLAANRTSAERQQIRDAAARRP